MNFYLLNRPITRPVEKENWSLEHLKNQFIPIKDFGYSNLQSPIYQKEFLELIECIADMTLNDIDLFHKFYSRKQFQRDNWEIEICAKLSVKHNIKRQNNNPVSLFAPDSFASGAIENNQYLAIKVKRNIFNCANLIFRKKYIVNLDSIELKELNYFIKLTYEFYRDNKIPRHTDDRSFKINNDELHFIRTHIAKESVHLPPIGIHLQDRFRKSPSNKLQFTNNVIYNIQRREKND